MKNPATVLQAVKRPVEIKRLNYCLATPGPGRFHLRWSVAARHAQRGVLTLIKHQMRSRSKKNYTLNYEQGREPEFRWIEQWCPPGPYIFNVELAER